MSATTPSTTQARSGRDSAPPADGSGHSSASLRHRLADRGIDSQLFLLLPALVFILALFVYPFAYGFVLSFKPKAGDLFANYRKFFSDPFLYDTIWATFRTWSASRDWGESMADVRDAQWHYVALLAVLPGSDVPGAWRDGGPAWWSTVAGLPNRPGVAPPVLV